jgi:uncharacterized protein YndB with AHSA1/START domain
VWLEKYRRICEGNFQCLDNLLEEMKADEQKTREKKHLHTKRSTEKLSMNNNTFRVTTPSDLEIATTHVFNAPRRLIFDALSEPKLVKQWLLGPPGWTLPVCEIDLRVGRAYRYVWRHADGKEMGMGGVFREIIAPERIVNTERFEQPWYPGDALVTNVLVEQGGKTTLTLTLRFDTRETRDAVLKSGMERGVAVSYDRLEQLLTSQGSAAIEKGAGQQ